MPDRAYDVIAQSGTILCQLEATLHECASTDGTFYAANPALRGSHAPHSVTAVGYIRDLHFSLDRTPY